MTKSFKGAPSERQKFRDKFGKDISEFSSMQRATAAVRLVTRNNYYRTLAPFFLWIDESPDSVIENRKKDISSSDYENTERYERKVIAYAQHLLTKGQSGRGTQSIIGRIQGFFSNNSKRYALDMRRLKLPKARKIQKYSPSLEEIRLLYTHAQNYRDRLIVALMFQNGLSPVDVSEIKVGNLPLKEWGYYEKSRSKTGEIWHGVVTPDILYDLEKLLKITGNPQNGEPLFIGRQGPLDNKGISEVISELMQKAGFGEKTGFKPTSLRDAFEDALVQANINHKIKERMMGHSAGMEGEYGGANTLEAMIVDSMKRTYPLITLNGQRRETEASTNLQAEIEQLKRENQKINKQLELYGNLIDKIVPMLPFVEKLLEKERKAA